MVNRQRKTPEFGLEQFERVGDSGLSLGFEPDAADALALSAEQWNEPSLESLHGPNPSGDEDFPGATEGRDLHGIVAYREGHVGQEGAPEVEQPVHVPMLLGVVESFFFVGHKPISAKHLAEEIGDVTVEEVQERIAQLAERYCRQQRPYEIAILPKGYQLLLRRDYQRVADRLHHRERSVRLTRAAIEVLALVAYRQPLKRAAIDQQRGSDCSTLLRQLVRRGVLRITRGDKGHSDVFYHTTARFLQVFGLAALEELPRAEDLELL